MAFLATFTPVHLAALAVAVGLFCAGSSLTWTSPTIPKLRDQTDPFFENPLTSTETSWISSSLTLGAALGSFVYGYLARLWGRRTSWLLIGPAFILGYTLMYFVNNVEVYYLARAVLGMAVGGCFTLVPLYVGELSCKSERGQIVTFLSAALSIGFLYSYSVGPFISLGLFNLSLILFSILFFVLFFLLGEETPYYHVLNGRKGSAKLVLEKTRKSVCDIDYELQEIINKIENDCKGSFFRILFSRILIKGLFVATGLLFFHQMTGIFAFQFYTEEIFSVTGSNISPSFSSILMGSIQTVSAALMATIMDKFNRKLLLYYSAMGMSICHLVVGAYCEMKRQDMNVDYLNIIPLISLGMFLVAFNIGFGALPYTIIGEIFPPRCSNFAISFVVILNWGMMFVVVEYTEIVVKYLGIGRCFLILGTFCLLSIIFVKFVVIETKNSTLEDIQDYLADPSWNYVWMVNQDCRKVNR